MKEYFNYVVDIFRKRKIMKLATKDGWINLDGDVITYKGTKYIVNVLGNYIARVIE